ncbi:PhzF family phenazine biosynthesis protein [Halobacteriaceae archaeon SHR40]|uniref:PhzF family phenazine biosynthesis protein n=1 Tax=Halovenus amylolytica TaxID=2500550 RepID=UPI000FE41A0F
MERRQVLLVDVFAEEPTGGRPVAVVPDASLPDNQLDAIASELSTSGVVTDDDGTLTYRDRDGTQAVITAAVGGYAALSNRGSIASGTHELVVDGVQSAPSDPFLVDLADDGSVSVDVPHETPEPVTVETEKIAAAVGVDVATLDDVGADLPAAKTDAFGGTVSVPVNFLEHLSSASPDVGALASLLESEDCSRLFAFTFDTLEPDTDVHARVFDPDAAGNERPASGVGAAACSAQCARWSAFDGDRERITFETGRFIDRPGRIETTVSEQPTVGGTALTVLDADISLPPEEDGDGIIEV